MSFHLEQITATTIPDAWFQCVSRISEVGFRYEVQQGSYIGETRLEFDWITIFIRHPYEEPYDRMLPEIPVHLNIPNPVEYGYIEQYVPYLMTNARKKGEDYTYGSRLHFQIPYWIKILKDTPNTNQAILQVARPEDCFLEDPPCLRSIGMRIKNHSLIFYPMFRSWDLWGGMPANLAGIAVVQKYMADEIGVESGPMCASSKGLHVYGYAEELVKIRSGK
jgi:thymidylate synthase